MKNKTLLLFRTMFRAEDALQINMEKKGRIPVPLKYLGLLLILLLAGASFAPLVAELYPPLAMMGLSDMLLKLLLYTSALMVMLFSFFYVMSVFYFSSDIENYLYLPVKPGSLVLAKFFMVLLYEIATAIVLFYPSIAVFGYLDKQGPAFYLTSLITLLFLPIMPLSIMAILSMALMRFSKLFRNKDRFTLVSSLVGIFLALTLSNFMGQMSTMVDGQAPPLFRDEGVMATVLSLVFPAVTFMHRAILGTPLEFLLNLGLTLIISGAALVAFYFLGNLLYIDGAKGLKESGVKRLVLTENQLSEATRSRPALLAIAAKEMKTLLRTPVYFLNCILMTIILPIFFLIPMLLGPGVNVPEEQGLGALDLLALARQFITPDMVTLGIMAIMGFYAGLNVISATAISREGSNFSFMKYIPVPYRTQLFAKMIPAFLVEALGLIVFLVPLIILLRPTPLSVILGLAAGSLLTLLLNLLMLTLDVIRPVLNWSSEQKAVKQNFNAGISSILSFVAGGVPLVIYFSMDIDFPIFLGGAILLMAIASFILLRQLPRIAEKSFANKP